MSIEGRDVAGESDYTVRTVTRRGQGLFPDSIAISRAVMIFNILEIREVLRVSTELGGRKWTQVQVDNLTTD